MPATGIPDEVEFATKVQMARTMLARAFVAGVPAGWVTMDEAYGQSKSLRVWMDEHDQPHVVATHRNDEVVTTSMGAGADPGVLADRARALAARRNISTGELAYYVCYGPRKTRLMDRPASAGYSVPEVRHLHEALPARTGTC